MKNFGAIVGICLGVAATLVIAAVLFEGYQRTKAVSNSMVQTQLPSYANTQVTKTGTSGSFGAAQNDSQAYLDQLKQTQDDQGAQDLQSISSAASGL